MDYIKDLKITSARLIFSLLGTFFVLNSSSGLAKDTPSSTMPVKIPFRLQCHAILDGLFTDLRDPIKISLRRLNLLLIRSVNEAKTTPRLGQENDQPGGWADIHNFIATMTGGERIVSADPGVRQNIVQKFIRGLEEEFNQLDTAEVIQLLREIITPKDYSSPHLHPFRRDFDGVWDFLAKRNEWTNFVDEVQMWCLQRLVSIKTELSLSALRDVLENQSQGPFVEFVKEALMDPSIPSRVRDEAKFLIVQGLKNRLGHSRSILSVQEEKEMVAEAEGWAYMAAGELRLKIHAIETNLKWLQE